MRLQVIGVDAALAATGFARWQADTDTLWSVLSTITVHTRDVDCVEDRYARIVAEFMPMLRDRTPDGLGNVTLNTLVVLERPFIGVNAATDMKLAGLHYVLRYVLRARRIPFAVIQPTTLKKFATGHGRGSKKDMVDMAKAVFGPGADLDMGHWTPMYERDDDNSHEADALWCMAAGLYHLNTHSDVVNGLPMEPSMSVDQAEALSPVDFPDLDW